MNKSKQRKRSIAFIFTTVALIVIVLAFTGALIISSFQHNYIHSIVTNYYVNGNDAIRKIEYSLRYGKQLENFYGIEEMLQEKQRQNLNVDRIFITNEEGHILYDQNGRIFDEVLPSSLLEAIEEEGFIETPYIYEKYDNHYLLFFPIFLDNSWIGSIVYQIHEQKIDQEINLFIWHMIFVLVLLALAVSFILALIEYKYPFFDKNGKIYRKRMLITLLIILSTVQIIFGFFNYKQFSEAYIELANRNAKTASELVKRDVEAVIKKGVTYDKLYQIESYLDEIVSTIAEIEQIAIIARVDEYQYRSNSSAKDEQMSESFLYSLNIASDQFGRTAEIEVQLSDEYYQSRMREILLDTVTVIVTSFIFMVEVTLFVSLVLDRRKKKEQRDENEEMAIIRPLAFSFAMAIFLSSSFIPIYMKEIYEPLFGLSQDVVVGLPITIEMLFAGVGTLLAGFFIDKKGWKPSFIVGIIFFMVGSILSGLSTKPLEFIGARAIVGIGYGFSLMSLRAYVNISKYEKVRSTGFAAFFAGLYAGINVGVIVGSMLAERIGFNNVFYIAFAISLASCIFAVLFIKNRIAEKDEKLQLEEVAATTSKKPSFQVALQFLLNKSVLALFLFIVVPTTICSMFLDYYFPVFANDIGVSPSNIGRAFLLNGICIVYLAPLLSKIASKYLGIEKSIAISGVIVSVGLIIFASQGTLATAFLAVILLGIAESFGLVAQNNYFVQLEATNKFGSGKALGFYDNVRKLGQMAGPMVFGGLSFLGLYGVGVVAVITLLGVLIFYFVAKTASNKESRVLNG